MDSECQPILWSILLWSILGGMCGGIIVAALMLHSAQPAESCGALICQSSCDLDKGGDSYLFESPPGYDDLQFSSYSLPPMTEIQPPQSVITANSRLSEEQRERIASWRKSRFFKWCMGPDHEWFIAFIESEMQLGYGHPGIKETMSAWLEGRKRASHRQLTPRQQRRREFLRKWRNEHLCV